MAPRQPDHVPNPSRKRVFAQPGRGAFVRWGARLVQQINRLRLWVSRPLTVGVRLIFVRDGEVLLVRHTYHDGWLLPGGGVQKGETLETAARREALEEVGARINALRLLGVYTNFYEYKSDHVIVYACEDFALAAQPTDRVEIDCFEFFPLDALPEDLLPGHRRRIREYLDSGHVPESAIW